MVKVSISERVAKVVQEKRGRLVLFEPVPSYTNTKVKVECRFHHTWTPRIRSLLAGSWCPICAAKQRAVNRRSKIEDIRKLARRRGGKLLSETYRSAIEKLEWQCGKGHRWKASTNNVKAGSWCPECRRRPTSAFDVYLRFMALSETDKRRFKEYLREDLSSRR